MIVCINLGTEFRGVEVCAETTLVVTNYSQNFIWEGFGFKLYIPQGCLPAGMEQCTINIKASLAGQYEFPENYHLVSAVFWLCCEPKGIFSNQITLEVNHCAKSENYSKLSFVRAVCSQRHLPYTFKQIGGNFNRYSSYGAIEVNSFSGFAVNQEASKERKYCAMLFYLGESPEFYIHFVVTWNTEPHLSVSYLHLFGIHYFSPTCILTLYRLWKTNISKKKLYQGTPSLLSLNQTRSHWTFQWRAPL